MKLLFSINYHASCISFLLTSFSLFWISNWQWRLRLRWAGSSGCSLVNVWSLEDWMNEWLVAVFIRFQCSCRVHIWDQLVLRLLVIQRLWSEFLSSLWFQHFKVTSVLYIILYVTAEHILLTSYLFKNLKIIINHT